MATSSKRKSRKKSVAKIAPKVGDTVKMVPEYRSQLPCFYANYASVSHTATEVAIDFCLLAPPYNVKSEDTLTALVPVVARILVPPAMLSSLADAIKQQEVKQKQDAENKQVLIPLAVIPK